MKNKLLRASFIAMTFIASVWSNKAEAQWTQANTGLTLNEVTSFATIGNTIFCSTGNISGNGVGVFKSTDNGASWSASNTGLVSLDTRQIIGVGPNLFVAVAGTNLTDGGIYRSTDNGATWTASSTGLARKIAYTIACIGTTLYTSISAPSSVKDVYLSTDYGANWTKTTDPVLNDNNIKSIVMSGSNILIGSDGGQGGVFLSTDNGVSWSATSITNGTDALAVIGNMVFAATGTGVFKSADNGVTWTATTNTSGVIDNATALAVIGNKLIVATPSGRVFSTTDNGTVWTDISTGASFSLSAEGFGMTPTHIFAGVCFKSVGIWSRPLSELGGTSSVMETASHENYAVFPNPSQGKFSIQSTHPLSSVEIYNMLGEKVLQQISNDIDMRNCSKGVYFIKINSGTKSDIQKIVVQ